jgi:hypothetical protein
MLKIIDSDNVKVEAPVMLAAKEPAASSAN